MKQPKDYVPVPSREQQFKRHPITVALMDTFAWTLLFMLYLFDRTVDFTYRHQNWFIAAAVILILMVLGWVKHMYRGGTWG